MDLYSLNSSIPITTKRFTQKFYCFQNQSDTLFTFEAYYGVGKNKWQNVNSRPDY